MLGDCLVQHVSTSHSMHLSLRQSNSKWSCQVHHEKKWGGIGSDLSRKFDILTHYAHQTHSKESWSLGMIDHQRAILPSAW